MLKDEVLKLKKEKDVVILAHNYQVPEVQDVADFVGDSLGLSRQAAKVRQKTILFCGVHFMAETAAIVSPDKRVLIPDLEAGCSLSDSITIDQLRKWKKEHPNAITVGYVNTTAEIKSELDYCCTSSNAVNVVNAIPKEKEILFLPDMFLGSYVSKMTGRMNMQIWAGECHVHAGITPADIEKKLSELKNAELDQKLHTYEDHRDIAGKIQFSDGECPICHTKDVTVDPEYQMEHINQELKKIESEKTNLRNESSNTQNQIDEIVSKIKEIEYAENTIKNSPIKNNEHLGDWKNNLKLNQNRNNELEKIIESLDLSPKLVEFVPDLGQTFLDIEKLQKEIKDFKHEEYNSVEQELQTINSENQEILMQIGTMTEKINSAEANIKKNIPILEEMKLASKYIENLEKIKSSIFSKTSETVTGARNFAVETISRNASQYLEELKTEIKHLELFQEGSSIKIQCHTTNGQRPVTNLSGGEQVCVALAVRLGMSDLMIKSPLKIMVLDEPTAYLDKTHRAYFVDVIQELTRLMNKKQNFQFIIITHDDEIWESAQVGTRYKFTSTSDGTEVSKL